MSNRGPWLLTGLILAGIVYGSLYPFAFHFETGVLTHFLSTWDQLPQSGGDLLANLVLYFPFGFLGARALGGKMPAAAAASLVFAAGAALSLTMELLQFYDAGRVSNMSDLYLNSLGTLIGAIAGLAIRDTLTAFPVMSKDASLFAFLLLLAFAGWRLYPYEPVIDLHKYWDSLKPVILAPSLGVYDVFRYAMMWTAVVYLARYGAKLRYPLLTISIAVVGVFVAKILIVDQTITLPEIVGALIALLSLNMAFGPDARIATRVLAVLFVFSIVLERVLPFEISAAAKPFEWIPFYGFLHGALGVNVQSFLQKCFLYGSALYLLIDAGLRLRWAAALESLTVLSTSVLQTQLAGRSAEITDTLMVIFLAVTYSLVQRHPVTHGLADGAKSGA